MQAFSPVSNNKLYVQIYNQLHDAIVSGKFKVGDKLPSEKELSQLFNVSRVPVREALCALELNGMVDSIQGVGVYVKSTLSGGGDWMHDIEPQDIIRARVPLEPYIAYDAALHISEEDKLWMMDIMRRFKEEAESGVYTIETDKEFHLCVAKASGNTVFYAIIEMLMSLMDQEMWNLQLSRSIASPKYREQNYKEHLFVSQSILEGNAEESYRRMQEHMCNLPKRYWE